VGWVMRLEAEDEDEEDEEQPEVVVNWSRAST
jgi:hypothetical protein